MRQNRSKNAPGLRQTLETHEGGPAKRISPELMLRRSVTACMLWENTFYEDGEDVASRIDALAKQTPPRTVAALAVEARTAMKLRHVPLALVCALTQHPQHAPGVVCNVLDGVIQRPDELTEFLAIYWKNGRCPLAAQVKRGLARAFQKFNAYSLAKYNQDGPIRLRDVLFMVHAKPKDDEQAAVWKQLVDGKLPTPDTWEVALSGGSDKLAVFERLIAEDKLGAMALLRNLRNMEQAGVPKQTVRKALKKLDATRVLPFRFITAARHAPMYEPELEQGLFRCVSERPKFSGQTIVLVDVSGSMDQTISGKSEITRMDAACGIAMLARELCEDVRVFSFSQELKEVPSRRGFALRDAIVSSQCHSATRLGQALKGLPEYDRIIVVTDEQSADPVGKPRGRGYMVNVAPYRNGVGYGAWTHIDGFSEAVLDYIGQSEKSQ